MSHHKIKLFALLILALTTTPLAALGESDFRRTIGLAWEPSPSAQTYELEILQTGQPKPLTFLITEPEWRGSLPVGKYTFKVRGRDQRKVPGDWSEPSEFVVNIENAKALSPVRDQKVLTSDADISTIDLKWKVVPGAIAYLWSVKNDKNEVVKEGKTSETEVSVPLKVATTYTWSIKGLGPENFDSPAETVSTFAVVGRKLPQPNPQKPENIFVREVKWEKIPLAESYEYMISRWDPTQKKWVLQAHKTTNDTQAPFPPQFKGGRYRLQVRSLTPLRVSSSAAEIKFDAASGDRSPAAEEHALIMESVDHTVGYFAQFSYLITGVSYQGSNVDHTTGTSGNPSLSFNSAIGGTGRVGIGYLSPKSTWGFLGIGDYGGLIASNTLINYGSLEINAIRRNLVGSAGELRQMFGLFYKQYPDLIPNADSSFSATTVATVGPHYGIEYWYALNRKLGFQVNAQGYLNTLTMSTPNGNPVSTSLSYQFGFLGSYRLGPNMTGLMGYAYRNDSVSYSSTSGITDSISLTGNYLNLVLEWAL